MAGNAPHDKTLFHLVPANEVSFEALLHPDNKRFVSRSAAGEQGLEVGFHVPRIPSGHVITRLGRHADLVLSSSPRHPISSIHVSFEINPATRLIVLSVQSKRVPSVVIWRRAKEPIRGACTILYGEHYNICIGAYAFDLIWPLDENYTSLQSFTFQCYEASLRKLNDVGSRHRPTEHDNTEALLCAPLRDIPECRQTIFQGGFSTVYRSIDEASANVVAVKVVHLRRYDTNIDAARASLHKEVKMMQKLKHPHIIECLGIEKFHTSKPEIFMPLKKGSLTTLINKEIYDDYKALSMDVFIQMLSALDYLASRNLVHRDLRPNNILYDRGPSWGGSGFHFQLAEFGLVNDQTLAKCYRAPELYPNETGVYARETDKMDVWSLFATMVAIRSKFQRFPVLANDYTGVLGTLLAEVPKSAYFEPMARLEPRLRASAAQMLNEYFDGWGLTTRRSEIPPIKRDLPGPAIADPAGPYIEPLPDRRRAASRERRMSRRHH